MIFFLAIMAVHSGGLFIHISLGSFIDLMLPDEDPIAQIHPFSDTLASWNHEITFILEVC